MQINKILEKTPVIFVAKDPDKGLGFSEKIPGFYIMCPKEKITPDLQIKFGDSIIPSKISGSTRAILADENNLRKIQSLGAKILVFKNTPQIAKIARENNLEILNNSPELSSKIEDKISQFNWLENLREFLPPNSAVKFVKDVIWQGPFLIQWNTGHSGDGTVLIQTEAELQTVKEKFPDREGRISKKIEGLTFTNNNIVNEEDILIGNISFQITGLSPFTKNEFSTIGNDFGLAGKILTAEQIEGYKKIAKLVGEKLQKENYKGCFGLDLILEKETGKWFLIEINARQTSSVNLESWLQTQNEDAIDKTTFGGHLTSLLGRNLNTELTKINHGGQIILRNQQDKHFNTEKIKEELAKNFKPIFVSTNEKENEEILRIWTNGNIMKTQNEFSELGQKIIEIIEHHGN